MSINQSFLDGMSLIHLGVGMAMGLFRLPLWVVLVVTVGWEVAEHVLKIHYPEMFVFPSQDSLANATFDVLCALLGWGLAGPISRARGRSRAPRTTP
jgi:hypothetical protein